MRILFYDVATPLAYTDQTLKQRALGGTEATIIRIAHALAKKHSVYVAQHCRQNDDTCLSDQVQYISLENAKTIHPDIVILLRQHSWLEKTAQQFPHAKLFFWMHNSPSSDLFSARKILEKYHYQIIAVSHFHKHAIENRLRGKWFQRIFSHDALIPVHVIYNPIDDDLIKNDTPYHPQQLIFMSSPQKGLKETLQIFQKLLHVFPEYELLIANPGHRELEMTLPKQAKLLGALPHHQAIQYVRESFCVFYPQYTKVETFGLVYAEANAVGTPVLAHNFGAAPEVLSDPQQLINGKNTEAVIEKIKQWRTNRPTVQAKPEFRLSKIILDWENNILCGFLPPQRED